MSKMRRLAAVARPSSGLDQAVNSQPSRNRETVHCILPVANETEPPCPCQEAMSNEDIQGR